MNFYGGFSNGKMADPIMMRKMAMALKKQGRKGDTMLAHINPTEARLLDKVTDGGSINPNTGLPEYNTDAYNAMLLEQAENLPTFHKYTEPIMAEDPQDVVDAQEGVRGMQSYGRDPYSDQFTDIESAQNLAGQVMGQTPTDLSAQQITSQSLSPEITSLMNPYVDRVLQPTLDNINEQRSKALQKVATDSFALGAFGGDRHALVEADVNKEALNQAGIATDRAYANAYNNASNLAMQSAMANQRFGLQGDIARGNLGLGAMDRFAYYGDIDRSRRYQDIGALSNIGMDQRQRADMQPRFELGEFMRQQDDPYKRLQAMSAVGSSLPIKQSQTYYPSSGGGKGGGLF